MLLQEQSLFLKNKTEENEIPDKNSWEILEKKMEKMRDCSSSSLSWGQGIHEPQDRQNCVRKKAHVKNRFI